MIYKPLATFLVTTLVSVLLQPAYASDGIVKHIPMQQKESQTYYVSAFVKGVGELDLLVDTGSGYMTINEFMLKTLEADEQVTFQKYIQGNLADGSMVEVPVYRLKKINIGGDCIIYDIDVAVFPGETPCILGLSALRKMTPFVFSTHPPTLQLSNC